MHTLKHLKFGTIQQYVRASRCFLQHAKRDISAYSSFHVNFLLLACKNQDRASLIPKPTIRTHMSFPAMVVLFNQIKISTLGSYEKHLLWTLCLVCYFGCLRGSDFLPTGHGIDLARMLTWRRIRVISNTHIVIFLALTKQSKGSGIVKSLFAGNNKSFCPIHNLAYLRKIQGEPPLHEIIFRKRSGKIINSQELTFWLRQFLGPILGYGFSAHSFRAGIPSMMSEFPDLYTKQEAKQFGEWSSDAVEVYQRSIGVGNRRIHEKIMSHLGI